MPEMEPTQDEYEDEAQQPGQEYEDESTVAKNEQNARPFFSLLGRTFATFTEGLIATRTRLTLLQPEDGNTTVAVGRSVRFAVAVDGRVHPVIGGSAA